MSKGSFAQAFLSKKSLFEIVGTIAILATLFSSVGFSGWTYGTNLIQNGNFSEVRADNASLPANWYAFDWNDCSDLNASEVWEFGNYISGEYMNLSGAGYYTDHALVSDYIVLDNDSDFYYFQFDFYPYDSNERSMFSAISPVGGGGATVYGMNDSIGCNPFWNELDFNASNAYESISGGHTVPVFINPTISDIGDGWKRLTAQINMSETFLYNVQTIRSGGDISMTLGFLQGAGNFTYSLDNVEVRLMTWTESELLNLSIGLSEPVDGTRSMSSPIDFSYAVLSNYDVLNCSLVTDTIYHGGGWSVRQTNQTPVVEGGALNYFQLSGMSTKDTFVWTVACTTAYAPNVQYLAGNRTYIYDPMYAGDVATNILRLAPILLGLFGVLMTFVWVMNRESEEFLSVMLHMFVLYMILAVMLVIIFGIL